MEGSREVPVSAPVRQAGFMQAAVQCTGIKAEETPLAAAATPLHSRLDALQNSLLSLTRSSHLTPAIKPQSSISHAPRRWRHNLTRGKLRPAVEQ